MEITDSKGNPIKVMEDWCKILPQKKWEVGRSTFELAKFIIEEAGTIYIYDTINKLLNQEVKLERAIPEYNVDFDNFGNGRKHDLAIFGKVFGGNTERKVFIGIEAKVDEPFDRTVEERYMEGTKKLLNEKNSNLPERILNLLKRYYPQIRKEHFKLRYQLLFSLAGTVDYEADIHIFMVLVFKSKSYNTKKGISNLKDYQVFMDSINALFLSTQENSYKAIVKNKVGVEKEVYSIYKIIDKVIT